MNSSTLEPRRVSWLLVMTAALLALSSAPLWAQDDDDDTSPQVWIEDEEGEIDPRYERARNYHLEGQFEEAFRLYDQILAERPGDVPVLITYGHMLWKIGRFDEAEAKLLQAAKLNPKHIKAKQFLIQLRYHRGDRKGSKEQADALLALDWCREDVRHSAMINLGQIALQDEEWRTARKLFRTLEKEGNKADRHSGKRGQNRLRQMLELDDWGRFDSKCLKVHFAPSLKGLAAPKAREDFARRLDATVERVCARLGIRVPDPWHLYVFKDDQEAAFLTGRRSAYSWDYSWWFSYAAEGARIPPEHVVSVMLAARWAGSRPLSRCLVEGLGAWLAEADGDPHGPARKRLAEGRLRSMKQLQLQLRALEEHETLDQYEHGKSFVRYLIDTYGFDRFAVTWKHFNVTVNAPRFKVRETKAIDWEAAISAAFEKGLGVGLADAEAGWRAFLARD